MEGSTFHPGSPLTRFLPSLALSHRSTFHLHQPSKSLHSLRAKPPLRRLETVLTDCSEVQQSLSPIWKSACLSITGSLHLLETSREALQHPPERLPSWKTHNHYEAHKRLFAKRGSRPKIETLFTGTFNAERYWHQSEEAELLKEIRQYGKPEVSLGDTSHSFQTVSDLNRFILKEKGGILQKGPAGCNKYAVSKADKPQRKLLKATRVDNLKAMTYSQRLDPLQARRPSEVTSGLLSDFQAKGGYDRNAKIVEEYYKRQRERKVTRKVPITLG